MPSADRRSARRREVCQWTSQEDAFRQFATFTGRTQSQRHIKPLHWYVACRLVLEGGFRPDEIQPRPPFILDKRKGRCILQFDQSVATSTEATLLGGLKTKDVDVIVSKEGIGPVLAVSCKGMTGALRNLVKPNEGNNRRMHELTHHIPGIGARVPVCNSRSSSHEGRIRRWNEQT